MLKKATQPKSVTYSDAGVDIVRGDTVVENIVPYAKATARSGTLNSISLFIYNMFFSNVIT